MRRHAHITALNAACRLLLLCALGFMLVVGARAQDNSQAPQDAVSSTSQQPADGGAEQSRRHNVGRELTRESRESAGEGENDKFKHSASVRWVARHTGLTVDQVYWISVGVNFGVIVLAIGWSSKKFLPGLFRQRTSQIQNALEQARRASEDANRRLAAIESRLAQMDAEIAAMRAAAEKEGAAEEARLQAAALEDARKIVETAEQEIAAAAKSARRELTSYAADLAVALAAKQIRVDAATDQALVSDFAAQLLSDGGRKGGN